MAIELSKNMLRCDDNRKILREYRMSLLAVAMRCRIDDREETA